MSEEEFDDSWPDFTTLDDELDAERRLAHTAEFLADSNLGQSAVMFMNMAAFGISMASEETPWSVENPENEKEFLEVRRGPEGQYYCELSVPKGLASELEEEVGSALEALGWNLPNQNHPSFHREYPADTNRYDIAADGAKGWFQVYGQ